MLHCCLVRTATTAFVQLFVSRKQAAQQATMPGVVALDADNGVLYIPIDLPQAFYAKPLRRQVSPKVARSKSKQLKINIT